MSIVRLYRCHHSRAGSFDPARAGDTEFYAWLSMSEVCYEAARCEFGGVAERLGEGQPVVDLGLGSDGCTRVALDPGAIAVGGDEDPRARAAIAELGAPAHVSTAAAPDGPYKAVTAFKVVEDVERDRRMEWYGHTFLVGYRPMA